MARTGNINRAPTPHPATAPAKLRGERLARHAEFEKAARRTDHGGRMYMTMETPVMCKVHLPLYDVRLGGVCCELTQSRESAHLCYIASFTLPKQLWKIDETGKRHLLLEQAVRAVASPV